MAIDGDRAAGGGMGEPAGALVYVPDDLGLPVPIRPLIRRVVSLVPSLTETVAACAPGLLVGATNWCVHPADLTVTRIGGTKNPDIAAIMALRADVVLANEEENRLPDLDALRSAGQSVWVTRIRDLPEALASLRRMITLACRQPEPAWLDAAGQAWRDPLTAGGGHGLEGAGAAGRVAAVVPIWRRPWMVLGRDTFAGDLLARLGITKRVCRSPGPVPEDRHRGAPRCRGRPGGAAGRAVPVLRVGRPRGLPRQSYRARQRPAPDLVRAFTHRSSGRAAPPARRGQGPVRIAVLRTDNAPGASAHEGVPTGARSPLGE